MKVNDFFNERVTFYFLGQSKFVIIHTCCSLPIFAMMANESGINERFSSDVDNIHNKNQYIYQNKYSIKDI